ncbi:hypothetical protein BC941DRAFT_473168 [Chlamydoabsidia padenii]|nr:hypothetical protein BC941DRAFT_473168 [Chlamydoabsidia padenii]
MLRFSNVLNLQTVWEAIPSSKLPTSTLYSAQNNKEIIITDNKTWEVEPTKEVCSPSLPQDDSFPISEPDEDESSQSGNEKDNSAALMPTHEEEEQMICQLETPTIEEEEEEEEETTSSLELPLPPSVQGEEEPHMELPMPKEEQIPEEIIPRLELTNSDMTRSETSTTTLLDNDECTETLSQASTKRIFSRMKYSPSFIDSKPTTEKKKEPKSSRRYHFLGSRSTPDASPSNNAPTDEPLSKMVIKRKSLSKKLKQVFSNNKTKKGI